MPCPFFEPKRAVRPSTQNGGRLPLIDEYDGLCHASGAEVPTPDSARFRLCNHGNSKGSCSLFPGSEVRSCLRYEVTAHAEGGVTILCIEEEAYTPLRWYPVQYVPNEDRLDPVPNEACIRAQALAFARSYVALTAKP
jgi:hypothetical protein